MGKDKAGRVLPELEYEKLADIYEIVNQLPQYPLACSIYPESTVIQEEVISTPSLKMPGSTTAFFMLPVTISPLAVLAKVTLVQIVRSHLKPN